VRAQIENIVCTLAVFVNNTGFASVRRRQPAPWVASLFLVCSSYCCLPTQLKISAEDLAKEGLTHDFVGGCMLFETVVVPVAGLMVAFAVSAADTHTGITNAVGRPAKEADITTTSFPNPVLDDDETSVEEPI
jgi:hypothetical protein